MGFTKKETLCLVTVLVALVVISIVAADFRVPIAILASAGFTFWATHRLYALQHSKNQLDQQKRIDSDWQAMRAQVQIIKRKAEAYSSAGIISPSYRFPTTAYENTVPQLLSEAEISGDELEQIADFFGVVEDANRGLDYVHHFRVKAEEQLEGELDVELRRLSDLADENGRIDPANAKGWVKVMLYEHNRLLKKMEGLIEAPRAVRIDEIIGRHLDSDSQ